MLYYNKIGNDQTMLDNFSEYTDIIIMHCEFQLKILFLLNIILVHKLVIQDFL